MRLDAGQIGDHSGLARRMRSGNLRTNPVTPAMIKAGVAVDLRADCLSLEEVLAEILAHLSLKVTSVDAVAESCRGS